MRVSASAATCGAAWYPLLDHSEDSAFVVAEPAWLLNEFTGTAFECAAHIRFIPRRAEDHNRYIHGVIMPKNIMARHGGQVQIEDDKIWVGLSQFQQRVYTVRGDVKIDGYWGLGDNHGDEESVPGIVLDKQHVHGLHTAPDSLIVRGYLCFPACSLRSQARNGYRRSTITNRGAMC
jgi:hypothetical protein